MGGFFLFGLTGWWGWVVIVGVGGEGWIFFEEGLIEGGREGCGERGLEGWVGFCGLRELIRVGETGLEGRVDCGGKGTGDDL